MSSNDEQVCMGCLEDEESCESTVRMPCGQHFYCRGCFRQGLEVSMTDEARFPISCHRSDCAQLSTEVVQFALGAEPADQPLLHRYLDKAEEYSTAPHFRIYCNNRECATAHGEARFLNVNILGDDERVICPDCDTISCISCKDQITPDGEHSCETDDHDDSIRAYHSTLPEDESWKLQKCYRCRSWVEKTEACNHMRCRCTAEFCLLCGRRWEGVSLCVHGCPKYGRAVFDDEGYNQDGFHRDTGINREGLSRTRDTLENDQQYGWGDVDEDEGNYRHVYGDDGFDQWGNDADGYDRTGFDEYGLDREGRDANGFDEYGFNREGFDAEGFDRRGVNATGHDVDGFNEAGRDEDDFFSDGHDIDGFDRCGMSFGGRPRHHYMADGYDDNGFDCWGLDRDGYDTTGRDEGGYDRQGRHAEGYDLTGRDVSGYDRNGFNEFGRDAAGYDRGGCDSHHRNRANELRFGYEMGSDGNARRPDSNVPSMAAFLCPHQTYFFTGCARCLVCNWYTPRFAMRCRLCDSSLCRDCDYRQHSTQRAIILGRHLWLEGESLGLDELFGEVSDAGPKKP